MFWGHVVKVCTKCKKEKSVESFSNDKSKKDGKALWCKDCRNKADKSRHARNRDAENLLSKLRYVKNKDTILEKQKNYYEENKEDKKAYQRKYRASNKEKINKHNIQRRESDVQHKLRTSLRSRLNIALRGNQKSGSSVGDLGCSILELKNYLESKFTKGMSWDNHGTSGWHIDHILPLSSFDLENREQLLKACHYTNLQPLWWYENLRKSDNE